MILKRLWAYKNSLFVQLISLSVVVMFLIFLNIIVSPYLEQFKQYKDKTISEGILYTKIETQLIKGVTDFSYLETDELVVKIKAINPDFRFYIRTNEDSITFGGPPKDIPYYQGDFYTKRKGEIKASCLLASRGMFAFDEKNGEGIAVYNNCPFYRYYFEIAGINEMPDSQFDLFKQLVIDTKIAHYKNELIGMLLLITLSVLVILNVLKSLRKIIVIAQNIDLDSNREHIDEKGLPIEMLPLVDAFNDMLTRLEASYDKNKFFLAAAAHEIRTPLTVMRLTLEENEITTLKSEMKHQIGRMSELVENLLRLTKYSNTEALNTHPVELNKLAREVCASRVPLALDKGVEIEFIANETPLNIHADKALIASALSNVLDNALSFSERNNIVTLRVSNTATISVDDQGPGIDDEFLPYIFEPFNKKPPNRNGHGLGLALVKSIMELHHGSVSCHRNSVGGSCFKLHFEQVFTDCSLKNSH